MAGIQSTLVPLELSFNNGSTYQTLVCLNQYNMPLSKATNVTETFCGTEVGLGSETFNPNGTAVCSTNPTSSQVTYNRLLTAWKNEETVLFRCQYPGTGSIGVHFYHQGSAYVTDLELQFQTSQVIQFTFTLTGIGTIDITP